MNDDSSDPEKYRPEFDDLPPTGEEAKAQSDQTVMPLVWIGLGIVVVLGFIAVLLFYPSFFSAPSGGAAPQAVFKH